ncbi:MAG: CPBP family glutamic-type intramembrane protease [Pirellulaceae bacterium]|nr:CPBP family glutamic-type intramembrane protease [Pirellulaceae bacterium]
MAAFQSAILVLGITLGVGLQYAQVAAPRETLESVNWWGNGPVFAVAIGVGLALGMLGTMYWLKRMGWAWFLEIETILDQLLVPSLRRCGLWQLLVLALLAGVGEELLFRWAIQGWLELLGHWLLADRVFAHDPFLIVSDSLAYVGAATITAVLFGLCHAVTRAYWVLAAVMGLIFSLVVVGGGGLVGAIIAHGLYDFLAFLWLCQGSGEKRGAGAENEFSVG